MVFESVRNPSPEKANFWSMFVLLLPALIGTPLVYAYRWIVPEPYWLVGAGVLIAAVVGYIWYLWVRGADERRVAAERLAVRNAELAASKARYRAQQAAELAALQESLEPASLMEIEEMVANAPPEWRRMLVRLLGEEAQQGRQFSKGTIGRLNDYVHGRLSEGELAGPSVASDGFEHGPQADFIMKLRRRYDRSW